MHRNTFFQNQLDSIKPTQVKKMLASAAPCCTMPVVGQPGYQPACAGFPAGIAGGGVAIGIMISMATVSALWIAIPAWAVTLMCVTAAISELQENNREVALAEFEINYLHQFLLSNIELEFINEIDSDKFKHKILEFFNTINLNTYSKKNILTLILNHEDIDIKIALLEACLGDARLRANQQSELAKRFWKQEGFLACRNDTGTLGEIRNHLLNLNLKKSGHNTICSNPGLYLNRAR